MELILNFTSSNELDERFDSTFSEITKYYNSSKNKLETLSHLIIVKEEHKRNSERLTNFFQNQLEIASSTIELLKKPYFKNGFLCSIFTDDANLSQVEIETLVDGLIDKHNFVFQGIVDGFPPFDDEISQLANLFSFIENKLIPEQSFSKSYSASIIKLTELYNEKLKREQDLEIIQYIISKIISDEQYFKSSRELHFIESDTVKSFLLRKSIRKKELAEPFLNFYTNYPDRNSLNLKQIIDSFSETLDNPIEDQISQRQIRNWVSDFKEWENKLK